MSTVECALCGSDVPADKLGETCPASGGGPHRAQTATFSVHRTHPTVEPIVEHVSCAEAIRAYDAAHGNAIILDDSTGEPAELDNL